MWIPIEIPASALTAYAPDSLNPECLEDAPPTDHAQDWNLAADGRIVVRRGRPWGSGGRADTTYDEGFNVEYAIRFWKQESVWRANN
jgi:hypothetical protein